MSESEVAVPSTGRASMSLPALKVSVSAARRTVTSLCGPTGLADVCDTAALLTSEVVTNAVLHGDGTIEVRADVVDGRLRVEVQDQGTAQPVVREPGLDDEGGRGMRLLSRLADAWGVERVADGKYVWFELTGEHDDDG